jgi:hypothetical protein
MVSGARVDGRTSGIAPAAVENVSGGVRLTPSQGWQNGPPPVGGPFWV